MDQLEEIETAINGLPPEQSPDQPVPRSAGIITDPNPAAKIPDTANAIDSESVGDTRYSSVPMNFEHPAAS